jgi:cytochrome c553
MLASMLFGATAMLAGSIAGSAEISKGNLENGKKIFTEGKGSSVPACVSCHGDNGMGDDEMGTPRLAGQIAPFLIKQLEDFATDKRMDTTMFVMNVNAKGLSSQDRVDVATFINSLSEGADLSNLAELKANGTQVGMPYLGKVIVNYGIEEKGVPACKSCHGYNGRGVDPIYPKLNKQKFVYLVNQLKKWRDGSRTNDPMSQMQVVARKLSDADINNAASYLAGAADTTLGNSRTPEQHMPLAYDPRE